MTELAKKTRRRRRRHQRQRLPAPATSRTTPRSTDRRSLAARWASGLGEVNPRRDPDTPRNIMGPNNFGDFQHEHDGVRPRRPFTMALQTQPSVRCDSIYVAYRWYETAAAEGVIDYGNEVTTCSVLACPYTTFSQSSDIFGRRGHGCRCGRDHEHGPGRRQVTSSRFTTTRPTRTVVSKRLSANVLSFEKTKRWSLR